MEEIRTPWRMRYITSTARPAACIFCPPLIAPAPGLHSPTGSAPVAGSGPRTDQGECRDHFVVHRGTSAFVILNLYPYTTGHLMVVPYRHLPRFRDLTAAERAELALLLRESERVLRAATGARRFHAGINLGRAAGAGVEGHLHAHLVPRDATGEWADAPGASEPALRVDEAHRRLAPHFTIAGGSTL